ncbi:zinc finger CCCH domain-containing protein 13-like [Bradysia coprophila]|uniref:zinc finger CCCH domain-containing protein 13-like n=1 Tax=Bradysia coprophila TaxID=38358 RepID=UPI00187DC189|nr:zinc finger CCCH domain-containing protein 13-like [Bradysia coprophila]
MEEDISDALYGDLGDFEFNEQLKEQCQKIEHLTDQLNQSLHTITDLQTQMNTLKKDHQVLQQNASSLWLTAQVELKRKDLNISQLKQQIDNRIFRRRGALTNRAQSDPQEPVDPMFSNHNATTISNQLQHQPVGDLSQFRIPKKNPFARHKVDIDRQNHITARNGVENGHEEPKRHIPKKNPDPQARCHDPDSVTTCNAMETEHEHNEPGRHLPKTNIQTRRQDVENGTQNKQTNQEKDRFKDRRDDHISACNGTGSEHDEVRHHLPKKNPHARRHDVDYETQKKPTNEDKDKFNGQRDEHKGQGHDDKERSKDRRHKRRHSPGSHTSRDHRDDKKSHSRDRKRDSSRNNRKRSRGSSSDELDRHPKRHSESTTHRHRPKSRPERVEEKVKKTKSPRKGHSQHGSGGHRIDERKSGKDSVSSLKEKDLEAMLEAQKKILDKIDSTDVGQEHVQNGQSTQERRKRNGSHTGDRRVKTPHEDGGKDSNSSSDGNTELKRSTDASVEVIAESENTVEVLPTNIAIDQQNSDVVDVSRETVEELPVMSENLSQELRVMEDAASTNNLNLDSPFRVVKAPSESIDQNVAEDGVPKNATKSSTLESIHENSDGDDAPQAASASSEVTEGNSEGDNETKSAPAEVMKEKDVAEDLQMEMSRSTSLEVIKENVDGEDMSKKKSKSTASKPISKKGSEDDVPMAVITSTPSKLVKEKVHREDAPKEVSESAQLLNDDNSNMDIDYELMEHRPVENQTILPCKETDRRMSEEKPTKTMSPTASKDVTCNETIDESFLSMEVAVRKGNCASESTLNSSAERHTLSKSKEYTVEDAGYEIRIFLTKKRKKGKTAKVTS